MSIYYSFKVVILVLIFHFFGLVLNLYEVWGSYDALMHFAGGFAMAVLMITLIERYIDSINFKTNNKWIKEYFYAFLVLGFVMMIGVAWEWHEYILDLFFFNQVRQPGIADTMADLALDFCGGLLALIVYRNYDKL